MNHEIIEIARQAYENCDHIPDLKIPKEFIEAFAELVATKKRNDTLEEVAREFDKMKVFGDTAASFAIFVREMKS